MIQFSKIFTILLIANICSAQSFGIRAGLGQFASQAEQIDGETGNSFLFAINFNPKSALRIDIGTRYNGVNETEVTLPYMASSFIEIDKITQKIGYTEAYIAPGLNIDLSQIGTGIGAYIIAGGGLGFSTVITKIAFKDTLTIPLYRIEYSKSKNYWKPFYLLGAGLKAQIFYFGVFVEATYYDGKEVEYNPLVIYDSEIIPGGTISPQGFAAYLGINWN